MGRLSLPDKQPAGFSLGTWLVNTLAKLEKIMADADHVDAFTYLVVSIPDASLVP